MMNAKPPSESAVRLGLLLLRARDCVRNVWVACHNWTVGVLPSVAPWPYCWTTTPPNGPALTRVLYEVHGHQVRADGGLLHAPGVVC